eukprot:m.361856 g.361856  ORF g.361856 m.361856 type:complete len:303 (+) comp19937_c0_seq1:101-1009(+)
MWMRRHTCAVARRVCAVRNAQAITRPLSQSVVCCSNDDSAKQRGNGKQGQQQKQQQQSRKGHSSIIRQTLAEVAQKQSSMQASASMPRANAKGNGAVGKRGPVAKTMASDSRVAVAAPRAASRTGKALKRSRPTQNNNNTAFALKQLAVPVVPASQASRTGSKPAISFSDTSSLLSNLSVSSSSAPRPDRLKTYTPDTDVASRATFPGMRDCDNQVQAFNKGFDSLDVPLAERMARHVDFTQELDQFKDMDSVSRYFVELCSVGLSNNAHLTAEQKKSFFKGIKPILSGDAKPLEFEYDSLK